VVVTAEAPRQPRLPRLPRGSLKSVRTTTAVANPHVENQSTAARSAGPRPTRGGRWILLGAPTRPFRGNAGWFSPSPWRGGSENSRIALGARRFQISASPGHPAPAVKTLRP